MADKQFGGSKYFAMGAVWWFVVAGVLGVLHWFGLVETPSVVVIAVIAALVGSFAIVYFARPR